MPCKYQCEAINPRGLFYCSGCVGNLDLFLANFSIELLQRRMNRDFMSVINRDLTDTEIAKLFKIRPVNAETVLEVRVKHLTITNTIALDLAKNESSFHGFWEINCENDFDLKLNWLYLAQYFYNSDLDYKSLECFPNANGSGGKIIIVNDEFRDEEVIKQTAKTLRMEVVKNGLKFPQEIYYKPSFYNHVGIVDAKKDSFKQMDTYIYSYSLNCTEESSFKYADGVSVWMKNNPI